MNAYRRFDASQSHQRNSLILECNQKRHSQVKIKIVMYLPVQSATDRASIHVKGGTFDETAKEENHSE